jgi:hypothetical protein
MPMFHPFAFSPQIATMRICIILLIRQLLYLPRSQTRSRGDERKTRLVGTMPGKGSNSSCVANIGPCQCSLLENRTRLPSLPRTRLPVKTVCFALSVVARLSATTTSYFRQRHPVCCILCGELGHPVSKHYNDGNWATKFPDGKPTWAKISNGSLCSKQQRTSYQL